MNIWKISGQRYGLPIFMFIFLWSLRIEASELSEINALVENSRHREALELLQKIKPGEGERAVYYLLLAKALIGTERFNEALSSLQLAVSYGTGNIREEAMYLRANLYLKKRFYPEASTNFRVFLSQFPESKYSREALLGLAESLRKTGQYNEALKTYDKAGSCIACLYGKANTLHLMGRYKDASNLYFELLLNDNGFVKTSPETMLLVGENMMLLGKKDEAKRFLNSIKEPPFKYHAYLLLGEIELNSGKFNDALKFFEQSLQGSDPKLRQKAYLLSAEALISLGRLKEAEKRLEELRAYPFGEIYEKALLHLSELYRKEQRYREASAALKTLLLKRVPPREATEELKTLLIETGMKESRTFISLWKEYKRFLLDSQNISFLFEISDYMKSSKKDFFELARWLYRNTSGHDKRRASFLLAEFYLQTGEPDMGIGILNDIRPERDEEIRLLAGLFIMKKDYESAFRYLARLKEIKAQDVPMILELTFYRKDPELISMLERAVNIADAPAFGYLRLADLLYERDKNKALYYYTIALSEKKRIELKERDIEWASYRIALIRGKPSEKVKEGLSGLLSEERDTITRLRRKL